MHERPAPRSPLDVMRYLQRLQQTPEYLEARKIAHEHRRHGQGKRMAHHALQEAMSLTVTSLESSTTRYEQSPFNTDYNEIIKWLPALREGQEALDRGRGDPRANKEKVIHFNHALKDFVNANQSTPRATFRTMIGSTMQAMHFGPSLIETVQWDIFPGMEHEIAEEENLYRVPGNFLVLEGGERPEDLARPDQFIDERRRVAAELSGADYVMVDLDTNDEVTIDCKKSKEAALDAQMRHNEWRRRHGMRGRDNHLIIWTGYKEEDFIADKIGRVTEAARLREQPRIDRLILGKFAELRQTGALLTK